MPPGTVQHLERSYQLQGSHPAARSLGQITETLSLLAFATFITFDVFGGLLRYLLQIVDLDALIYAPNALALLALFLYATKGVWEGRADRLIMLTMLILLSFGVVALAHGTPVGQVAFALWMYLPFVVGVLAARGFAARGLTYPNLAWGLYLAAVAGVFLDARTVLPWEGATYAFLGAEITASRSWSMALGDEVVRRSAGFSRASFAAAIQILILGIFLAVTTRSQTLKACIWLTTGLAIVLTTTKGVLTAYFAVTFLMACIATRNFRLCRATTAVLASLGLIIPFLPLAIDFSEFYQPTNSLTFSLYDRLAFEWPRLLAQIGAESNYITGRGIGAIGTPQLRFDPGNYHPGDSTALYLFANFGLLGICLYILVARWALQTSHWNNAHYAKFSQLFGVALFTYGTTTSVPESVTIQIIAGVLIASRYSSCAIAHFPPKPETKN